MSDTKQSRTHLRGFASLSPEQRREIASKGGSAVRPENRSFSQNRALASEAGRKGGTSVRAELRAYAQDKELARRAGKAGGSARSRKRKGVAQ